MPKLEIEYVDINSIKPYKGNAKKHPPSQIAQIVESIQTFGMNDPIAVSGPDSTIVEGHGRYLACLELAFSPVPVIRLDHLSDEQRRAYNLVHNKLTLNSDFDLKTLAKELDNIFDIDMGVFDFDVSSVAEEWEEKHQKNVERDRFTDDNILGLAKRHFPGVGKYDIPQIHPVVGLPEVKDWIGFNYVLTEKNPEGKGVHFFLSDYQFERIWNNPEKYVDKLRQFAVVATPDFSPYGDMPFCLQLYNHYRKHWVGAFLQENGVTVIPTIRASSDIRSLDFWLDGEPEGGSVIISTMWATKEGETEDPSNSNYPDLNVLMNERLHPERTYVYGKYTYGIAGPITRIPMFTERFSCGR